MSIENFIDNVMDKDYTSAQTTFADLMHARMQDALDQQKIIVAGRMFDVDDEDDDEIEDEDLEDAFDDEDLDDEDLDEDEDEDLEEDDDDQ